MYMAIVAARHVGVGVYALIWPLSFTGRSLDSVRAIAPVPVWGVLFLVIGGHAGLIVVVGRELHTRLVLTASAAVTGAWATAFVLAGVQSELAAPSIPIVWLALTGKDLVVSGMQLRLPIVELPAGWPHRGSD
jgi:hypothetical protein